MRRILYTFLDKIGLFLTQRHLSYIHAHKNISSYLYERPIEYAFTLDVLHSNQVISVLDVGTGTNSFSSTLEHCGFNVTSSDMMGSYWKSFQNRHIYVCKDDITKSNFETESFDAVVCISTLEHIVDYNTAVEQMVRIVKKDGILILTMPYSCNTFCENVYELEEADAISKGFRYIARSFCDAQIEKWCNESGLYVVNKKYARGWEGKCWRSGKRIKFPYVVEDRVRANHICLSLRKK